MGASKLPLLKVSMPEIQCITSQFHSPLVLNITMNSIRSRKHLGCMSPHCRFSDLRLRIFFHLSGESNLHPWQCIKSSRNQHIKCNERQTRSCHMAYSIMLLMLLSVFLCCWLASIGYCLCFFASLVLLPPSLLFQALLLLPSQLLLVS